MSRRNVDLGSGSVGKLLFSLAVPTITSQIVNMLYNLVDRIYIGHIPGDGSLALTGVGVCLPIIMIISAFSAFVSSGGAPRASIAMGRGDYDQAQRILGGCFTLQVGISLVLTAVLLIWNRPLLLAFGASGNTIGYAVQYMQIYALGTLFVELTLGLNAFITAQGFAQVGMKTVLIGAVCNILLDPLFIFALDMGVRGAALATVLAQWASFVVCLVYVLRHRDLFGLVRRQISFHKDKMVQILKLGIPCAVQMTVVGLSWLAMTFLINAYGVEASAASGICAKVKDVALLVTIALYTAATTMVAQCLGAKKFDRASRVVHVAMRLSLAVTAVLILGIELLAPQILSVFHPDQGTMEIAVRNLRIEILGQIFYASFMVYNALPMGAGHTMFALGSSLLNCIVVRVILALILNHFYGLVGIFWACAIAPASSVPLGYLYERTGVWRRALVQGEES